MSANYEFGDFSFFKNNREYYDHTIFLSIIDNNNLWDFVREFGSNDMYSVEYNNKYLIFENYYNNANQQLDKDEYMDIMDNFELICDVGWDKFVESNI